MKYILMKHIKREHMKKVNMKHAAGKSKQFLAMILGGALIFGMTGAGAKKGGISRSRNH